MNELYDDLLHYILGISFDLELHTSCLCPYARRKRVLAEIIPLYFSLGFRLDEFRGLLVCKKWYFYYRRRILQYVYDNLPNSLTLMPFPKKYKPMFESKNGIVSWNIPRVAND